MRMLKLIDECTEECLATRVAKRLRRYEVFEALADVMVSSVSAASSILRIGALRCVLRAGAASGMSTERNLLLSCSYYLE